MWRKPYRPNNEVTQSYNDGVVMIYSVENTAKPGYKPVEGLNKKVTLRYEEQRLGIQRYYESMQNQIEVERVIRTQRVKGITNQDVAITEDNRQYRIDLIQLVPDSYPISVDITLTRIEQEYEVSNDMV